MELDDSLKPSNYHPLLGVDEIVAFDLETTGLRSSEDEITQVAAARLRGWGMQVEETYCTYVNPGKPIPELAQKITKIHDHDVEGAPKPLVALQQFSKFAGQAILFGHDIYRFDFKFIKKHLAKNSDIPTKRIQFIDTMDVFQLFWDDFSRLSQGLDEIADRLDTSISKQLRHRADGDVLLLSRILQRIQTNPKIEEIAAFVPIHEGELPDLPIDSSLN